MMQPQKASLSESANFVWGCALAVWVTSIILLGGPFLAAAPIQTYVSLSSIILIALGLLRLRQGLPTGSAVFAAVVAVASLMLILAQLIPLPYDLWKSLPGRDVLVAAYQTTGDPPKSLALSLSPSATRFAALSVLPALAVFVCVLSVPRRLFGSLSAAILLCALISVMIGFIQKSQGVASGLFFYSDPGPNVYATGTFQIRSHFAAQMAISVPFLAAFAMSMAQRFQLKPVITFAFATLYIGLLMAGLAISGSRAGIILAMVSVLVTFLFIFRPSSQKGPSIGLGKGLIAALLALIVMAQASMVGILRVAETDPIQDLRTTIAAVNLQAAKAQFPVGSGFGTFVPVYQLYETPATIVNPYINHAHNEWLEVAIEGGAPAIALMVVFLLWLAYGLIRAIRLAAHDPGHAHIKAAGLALVMLLAHSTVDFPLRTDALLMLFGLCAGLLTLASLPAEHRHRSQTPRVMAGTRTPTPAKYREFTPASPSRGRGFGSRPASAASEPSADLPIDADRPQGDTNPT
jgi:O-antigen ligase